MDVSDWRAHALEPRGKRPKRWLIDGQGGIWLRKAPWRPHAVASEPAIEVFALELARRAGIEAAETRPAFWREGRGVVSRRFHAEDETSHPGSELLGLPGESGAGPDAKRQRDEGRAAATLARVRGKLLELEADMGVQLVAPFVRILAFDAWIGNADRHSGNWAVITGPRGARLSAMYDPAACLGSELTEGRRELANPSDEDIARYAERCGSGFGGGADGRTGIPMSEVLGVASGWPEWALAVSELGPRFRTLTGEAAAMLDEIPTDWLSDGRKRFALRLLARRVTIF
jgi:hypothetical protein